MKRILDEEGLELLKQNIEQIGHIPTFREAIKLKIFPSFKWYTRRFGSFDNALMKININILSRTKMTNLTKEDLVIILKEKFNELGKSPNCKDMHNPSIMVFYNRFNTKSWNKILFEAGLPLNHEEKSYDENVKLLKDLYINLGRIPTRKEIDTNGITPTADFIYYNSMTIEEFYYNIGMLESKPLSKQDRIDGSINLLKKLAEKLNRCPTVDEYDAATNDEIGICRRNLEINLNMKYIEICTKYLTDYINTDKKYVRHPGIILYDKNYGMCRSIPEQNITNYFIDNNIKYEKNVKYSDIIEKDKKKKASRTLDWIIEINNQKIYIEYFGMYYAQSSSKIVKNYVKKAKKKMNDLYKAGLMKQCLFIFPNDIKDNNLEGLQRRLKSFFMSNFNIKL